MKKKSQAHNVCCYKNCNTSKSRNPELKFYRVPSGKTASSISRRDIWIHNIGCGEFPLYQTKFVCSRHFESKFIQENGFFDRSIAIPINWMTGLSNCVTFSLPRERSQSPKLLIPVKTYGKSDTHKNDQCELIIPVANVKQEVAHDELQETASKDVMISDLNINYENNEKFSECYYLVDGKTEVSEPYKCVDQNFEFRNVNKNVHASPLSSESVTTFNEEAPRTSKRLNRERKALEEAAGQSTSTAVGPGQLPIKQEEIGQSSSHDAGPAPPAEGVTERLIYFDPNKPGPALLEVTDRNNLSIYIKEECIDEVQPVELVEVKQEVLDNNEVPVEINTLSNPHVEETATLPNQSERDLIFKDEEDIAGYTSTPEDGEIADPPNIYKCYQCGICFGTNFHLENHLKLPHSYKCERCGKCFRISSRLEKHLQSKHGIGANDSDSKSSSNLIGIQGSLGNRFGYRVDSGGKLIDSTHVVCFECEKKFIYPGIGAFGILNNHLKTQHPSKSDKVVQVKGDIFKELANWIATSARPVDIIDDAGLKTVLRTAIGVNRYKGPSIKVIQNRIDILYETERFKITNELKDAEFVSLSGELWGFSTDEQYLCVSAHWITNSWQYFNVIIQVQPVYDEQFPDLFVEFEKAAEEFKIADKVVAVCTDRNEVLDLNKFKYDNLQSFAHLLQLNILKALRISVIARVIVKCREVVKYIKRELRLESDLFNRLKKWGITQSQLHLDTPSRWITTLHMMQSLLNIKDALVQTPTDPTTQFTNEDWEILQNTVILMQQCSESMGVLGGKQYATASVLIPAVSYLRTIMTVDDTDPEYIRAFKTLLITDLTEQLSEWPSSEIYEAASALDPRFKNLSFFPEEKREATWLKLLNRQLKDSAECPSTVQQNIPKRQKMSYEFPSISEVSTSVSSLVWELNSYKRAPQLDDNAADPFKWWQRHYKEFPTLAKAAKKLLCIPSSSLPSESVFSVAGITENKFRYALGPDDMDKQVCLKSWLNRMKL